MLVAHDVELVVVGGCALVLLGLEVDCGDLDIVPEPSTATLARLGRALDAIGATRPADRAIAARPLTSVTSPFGRIDLLVARAHEEYSALAQGASMCAVEDVPVPVAAVADVLRLRARFREPTRVQ